MASARTPVLPNATVVGALSALCGLLGIHTARTTTSSPGAGYPRELHDRYLVLRFLSAYDGRLRQARSTANRLRSASSQ